MCKERSALINRYCYYILCICWTNITNFKDGRLRTTSHSVELWRRDGRKFADCSNAALHCALVCVCCTVRHEEVLINHIATQHTTLRHAKLVTLHQI